MTRKSHKACHGAIQRVWDFAGAAGAKKNCEIGVGFSFAALSVFRLRRAEAASAVGVPCWYSARLECSGAPRTPDADGNLAERGSGHESRLETEAYTSD